MKKKLEPKFKVGDVVKYYNKFIDKTFFGTVAYVIESEVIAYGVLMDYDLKVYNFNEKVLKGEMDE